MLPPRVKEAQVLSHVVLHNGNCKAVDLGASAFARAAGSGALPHERETLAPALDPLL
jgi:hypothetical protein